MKRSVFITAVQALTRDLGRPPVAAEVAGKLTTDIQPMSVATAEWGLKFLVKEGLLEAVGRGYRVSTVDRRTVTIGAPPPPTPGPTPVPEPTPADDEDPFGRPGEAQRLTMAEAVRASQEIRENAEQRRNATTVSKSEEEVGDATERGDGGAAEDDGGGAGGDGAGDYGRLRLDRAAAQREDLRHDDEGVLEEAGAGAQAAGQNASQSLARGQRQEAGSTQVVSRSLSVSVGPTQIAIIRVIMALSGAGASVASGYFAITRLEEFMVPALAVLLGTFVVTFAVIAFEVCLVFIQRRSYFIAGVFVFLWLLTVVFTLNATVAGFYTAYTNYKHGVATSNASENANKSALDALKADEASLTARIAVLTADLQANERTVQNTTGSAEDRSNWGHIYYDAQTRITADGRALDDLQGRLQAAQGKETALLAATPAAVVTAARTDYFEWAGGLLHIQPATMELVSAILPAMFVDLISSIGLAVALFLQSERKRRAA